MTSYDRRPKGRNNNRRHGRRNYGSRSSHIIKLNDQGRTHNHHRVKFNGNATKLFEKYKKLALEALSIGDKVTAENYFQHADHFARMLPSLEVSNNNTNSVEKDITENSSANSEDEIQEEQSNDDKQNLQDNNTVVAKTSLES